MIYFWVNNPTRTFSNIILSVWYNSSIVDSNTSSMSLSLITVSAFELEEKVIYFVGDILSIVLKSSNYIFSIFKL